MTTLVPFGETWINPDHVASLVPERRTPDGAFIVTVYLTTGPTVSYEVAGAASVADALTYVAGIINTGRLRDGNEADR